MIVRNSRSTLDEIARASREADAFERVSIEANANGSDRAAG
jgi:hypothetical protein